MLFDLNLVKRYLYIPADDSSTDKEIFMIADELENYVNFKHYYQVFNLKHNPLRINELDIESEILNNFLKNSNQVIILACTTGIRIEKYLKRMEIIDKSKQLIADAILSAAIETYQDSTIKQIADDYPDKHLSRGFAPGYPGLDISFQKEIFKLLNIEKRLGITLNESYLMNPRKSSTALIGISNIKFTDRLSCLNCDLKDDCKIRRNGDYCGK